jgi:uncharacterized membrane protein YedE/YeeE
MYELFTLAGTLEAWKINYCTADFTRCERHKRNARGETVPIQLDAKRRAVEEEEQGARERTMTYWPFWLGGLALAGIALTHWLLVGRMFGVSGRFTALVNRARERDQPDTDALTPEELAEAMRELTAEEFGPDALETPPSKVETPAVHLVFFGCVALGGLLSALLTGTFHPGLHLSGQTFARLLPGAWGVLALPLGGVLVGFGTRMAGGCTSGHGLCGTSRLQPGSLLATVCFFGAAVATSFALGWLR